MGIGLEPFDVETCKKFGNWHKLPMVNETIRCPPLPCLPLDLFFGLCWSVDVAIHSSKTPVGAGYPGNGKPDYSAILPSPSTIITANWDHH